MVKIECNPYERGDIIKYLELAKEVVYKRVETKEITPNLGDYEIERIKYLIDLINGKVYTNNYNLQSNAFRKKQSRLKNNEEELVVL